MITFPNRVWLKTDKGWFSRPATDYDHQMNSLIRQSFEPGGQLTPEQQQELDRYNESLRLEAKPLEIDMRVKHGHTLPVPQQRPEKNSARRSTRGNATFRMNFPEWMRRMLGV